MLCAGAKLPSFLLPSTQGLRSCTQVVGCLVSLSMLSTRLTLLLMVAMPSLMGVGTLMGSALRKLSRQCQEQVREFPPILLSLPFLSALSLLLITNLISDLLESLQVARATGVADEALGNVRTVRAFAMEHREEE